MARLFVALSRGALFPLALAGAWEALARSRFGDPIYSPSIMTIASSFWAITSSGELSRHLSASGLRMVCGFALALGTAVPLGLGLGWSRPWHRRVHPLFELLRPFPSITLVPIAIVWFGIGDGAKIFLVAYAAFWPLFLNSITGAREIDPVLLRAAAVMEIRGWALARKVVLPAALPGVMTGARLSLAVSVIVLIVSEMVAASSGVGFLIVDAERNYLTGKMFAGVLVMGLFGAGLNAVARILERRLFGHREASS